MRQPIIGYGRVEPNTPTQLVGRRHQINSIKKVGGFSKIDFEMDVATGGSSIKKRPALLHQIHKAHEFRVPLCVEAADRVLSTYSKKRIRQLRKELNQFGVQIAVAHNNPMFHLRIRKILAGPNSESQKRRSLVRRVDQYLRWRHGTIFSGTSPAPETPLASYSELKHSKVIPALKRCTKHLLELDADSPEFDWYAYAYLGAAFEERTELLQTHIRAFSYGMHPQHARLFQKIHELEQRQLKTFDGRPKSLSSQAIADELNRQGFRNLRGTPFSRKTIFQIRRSPAYRGSALIAS